MASHKKATKKAAPKKQASVKAEKNNLPDVSFGKLTIDQGGNLAIITMDNRFYAAVVPNWDPNQRFDNGPDVTHQVNLSKYLENAPRKVEIPVISEDCIQSDSGITFVEIENPIIYG